MSEFRMASYIKGTGGRSIWLAVDKNEKLGYKRSITETKTKPVVLSQVVFCTKRGMSAKDTSFVTSMSTGLVKGVRKVGEDSQAV